MILKMEKLLLVGMEADKQNIVRALMSKKCVQLNSPEFLEDYDQIKEVASVQGTQTYELEQEMGQFAQAISAVSSYTPKAKLFTKKQEVTLEDIQSEALYQKAVEKRNLVEQVVKDQGVVKSARNSLSFVVSSLLPWQTLDLPLDMQSTKTCEAAFYILPAQTDMESLEAQLVSLAPTSWIQLISEDALQKYVAVVYHKKSVEQVMDVLKNYNTTRMDLSIPEGEAHSAKTVAEHIRAINSQIEGMDKVLEGFEQQLQVLAEDSDLLKFGYDAVGIKIEKQKAQGKFLSTKKAFVLNGWIAERSKADVEKLVAPYDCFYEFTKPAPEEQPPILLKNNKLVEPFEVITEMYSLPSSADIDPNPMMMPFFFIFFGMMLSDAGYGLLLIAAGLLGPKLMSLSDFGKKFMKLIFWGGVSTVLWGAAYGGWFGDAITQIGNTFFHVQINIPKLIDPIEEPIFILGMSLVMGAVQLLVGMGIKAYIMVKQGNVWGAVFDVGFWYMFLLGLPMLALPQTQKIGMIVAIAGAAGLVLTQGRHKKGIIGKATSGILSLYDVTGYFSDVLSYSRILALGLATGVIASVVNMMGTLMGGNIFGALLFIAVFLFGHSLNLGINALGSYVHASRLQYVEYYGKFFEGGGKAFRPLQADTKYTYISNKEEQ